MKKVFLVLAVSGALSGCASMIAGMGGATADQVKTLEGQVTTLREENARLREVLRQALDAATQIDSLKQDLGALRSDQARLESAVRTLPRATLRRMAELMLQAAETDPDAPLLEVPARPSPAPAGSPAPGPAPTTGSAPPPSSGAAP